MLHLEWKRKIHDDKITSISIYPDQNFFVTTCLEYKVIISKLDSGQFIDNFKNYSNDTILEPIAFKNIST